MDKVQKQTDKCYWGARTFNLLCIALFIAGMGVFLIGTPKYIDDYLYISHYRNWFLSQGITYPESGGDIMHYGFPVHETLASWVDHYRLDNGRLGNMIATPLLLFPKWVGGSISLLCLIYSLSGVFKLSGIEWKSSPSVPFVIVMWMFIFPWWDNMGALTFQFNYLFPMALSTWLLLCLFQRKTHCRPNVYAIIKTGLIGFLVGCSNEGFSVPILIGLVGTMIAYREERSACMVSSIIGLSAGIILLALSPGMNRRAEDTIDFFSLRYFTVETVCTGLPLVVMTLWVLIREKKRNSSERFTGRLNTFYIVSGWISFGIVLITDCIVRAGWWAIYVSIAGLSGEWQQSLCRFGNKKKMIWHTVGLMFMLPVCFHLYGISENALHNRKMLKGVFDNKEAGKSDTWFGNVRTLDNMPIPAGITGATAGTIGMMYSDYYFRPQARDRMTFSVIIPSALEYVREDSGTQISGGSGIRKYQGFMFMPANSNQHEQVVSYIFDYSGYKKVQKVFLYRFLSKADGKPYDWIVPAIGFPIISWYNSHFRSVSSITPVY